MCGQGFVGFGVKAVYCMCVILQQIRPLAENSGLVCGPCDMPGSNAGNAARLGGFSQKAVRGGASFTVSPANSNAPPAQSSCLSCCLCLAVCCVVFFPTPCACRTVYKCLVYLPGVIAVLIAQAGYMEVHTGLQPICIVMSFLYQLPPWGHRGFILAGLPALQCRNLVEGLSRARIVSAGCALVVRVCYMFCVSLNTACCMFT